MNRKILEQSITSKLAALARKEQKPFANLRTQFLIERLLDRLASADNIRNNLVFKGGYVCLRIYNSPRFTTDIDAVARLPIAKLVDEIRSVAQIDREWDAVWFRFQEKVDLKTKGEYQGKRLVFRSGIGAVPIDLRKSQIVNLDLSVGDSVFPNSVVAKTEGCRKIKNVL